jgi:hypothetical protein
LIHFLLFDEASGWSVLCKVRANFSNSRLIAGADRLHRRRWQQIEPQVISIDDLQGHAANTDSAIRSEFDEDPKRLSHSDRMMGNSGRQEFQLTMWHKRMKASNRKSLEP